jgi:acyl-[acyl-carrier-protein]-phospholipid O-acyltransferase/long-chain-fatty-acid--[acyl-carrier-protein] ligase
MIGAPFCLAQAHEPPHVGLGLVVSLLVLGALFVLCWRWPASLYRPIIWVLAHTVYRVRVLGAENVPAHGPALLVCNHVSYVDWLLLLAAQRRFIRFVIFAAWTKTWGIRHLLRWAKVIPIDGSAGPRAIVKSLQAASDALKRGELVCIFAEGRFTRTGFLLPFHRGFEQIVKRCSAPIIPVCLDHVWGSIFSYRGGKLVWKWPEELPYPVSVAFGPPMPPTSTAAEVRMAVQKLSADCAAVRASPRRMVHRQFVRMAARHPFRSCWIDSVTKRRFRFGEALAGAMLMARELRPILGDEPMVGVWLPSSAGGAFANVALALLGKTSVNLNYTSSPAAVQSAIRQCNVRHVLTSERFLSKMKLEAGPDVQLVILEELRPRITRWDQIRYFLTVLLLPRFVLDRWVLGLHRTQLDDLATIIFSSGSTGEPKGVMLTHRNIAANAESMIQAIDLRKQDRALGILPFFHAFGYTVTLWVPIQVGASVVYHPDPRQAKEVGDLCKTHRCTILLTTPTFLRFCLRRCEPDDFRSVRILMCGAEKLPQPLAREFNEKFGVLPLEGYGCTELSPAAAANVPDRDMDGFKQIGNRPGTIGQPLPGVAARVVNPDTLEPVPPGNEGLLLIYGPNVMKGYLGRDDQTRAVVRDGWYITGDMAKIDEDGFVTITGRLSRFAKVGGEMVPLEKVEEELHHVLGTNERVCAVTSVPDEKKGERLVVLHTPLNGTDVRQLCQQLGGRGLPNLWVPGERDFYEIPELPILGSGKLDLKRLKELAVERVH